MIFLVLSIAANAAIYLVFKAFDKAGIQTLPAIVMNYITAKTIGLLVVDDLNMAFQSASSFPIWVMGGLSLGIVFISIFYLMAITAQKVGVSVTTIASKMSMALAVLLFLWVDPSEKMTLFKGIAVICALAGVVLSSLKSDEKSFSWKSLSWPLLILVGSTVIDFGIAYFAGFVNNENELKLYSCLSFGIAGFCGICALIFQLVQGNIQLRLKDLMAGVGLGLINYGSIYFLVQSYVQTGFSRSTVICINNLAVVIVAAALAMILFREKQSPQNILGILLSVVAIVLLWQS